MDFSNSDNTIENFKTGASRNGKNLGHFTQVIWATMTQIGCTRFYTPNPQGLNFVARKINMHYSIICDYGAAEPDRKLGANLLNHPVYKRGKPCTACRWGKCENAEYPSLCGKIHPVPIDPPFDFDNVAANSPNNIRDSAATRPFCTATSCKLYFTYFAMVFVL